MYICLLFLFFLILVFILSRKENSVKNISSLLLIFFTIAFGCRYDVGIDYKNYESLFNINSYANETKEFLWAILNTVIFDLKGNFYIIAFISTSITSLFIYLGIQKRKLDINGSALAIVLFLSNFAIIFLNIIRQGIAVSIIFYAFSFLKEKRYLWYITLCVIASLFHSSALLIMLLLIFFVKTKWLSFFNSKVCTISIFIVYLIIILNIPSKALSIIVEYLPMYSKYAGTVFLEVSGGSVFSLGVLSNAFVFIILIHQVKGEDIQKCPEIFLYFIGVIFNILSISTFLLDRIGVYFAINSIVAIPYILNMVGEKKIFTLNKQKVLITLVMFVSISLYSKTVFLSAEKLNLEYHSIFERVREE